MDTGIVSIIIAAMGMIGTIVVAIISSRTKKDVKDLAIKVDGRLTELLEITKSESNLQGNKEGQQQKKEEQAPQNQMNIDAAKAIGKLEGKQEEKDKRNGK